MTDAERLRRLLSHDLRSPLSVILAQSEVLLQEIHGPLVSRQVKSVEAIVGQSERLLGLMDEARALLGSPEGS